MNQQYTPSIPFPRSYWVVPGELLAGCYPGAKNPKEATAKLTALINSGIRHVINLMEPDERDRTGQLFVPYEDRLESIALVRHGLATGKNVLEMIRELRKDIGHIGYFKIDPDSNVVSSQKIIKGNYGKTTASGIH
jgi:hypothetical protein